MSEIVVWYKSQNFKALVQSSVLLSLGWVGVALTTNIWDWRTGLAIPLVANLVVGLRDWWSPHVQAPFEIMNKNNIAVTPKP